MPDQQKNAGNIGDIVKHVVLAEAVSQSLDGNPRLYIDTHAGFRCYRSDVLLSKKRGGQRYSADRQWTLRLVWDHLRCEDAHQLGAYGATLRAMHPHMPLLPTVPSLYPGSLMLAEHVAHGANWEFYGFDIGGPQLRSYDGDPRFNVRQGDGYSGAQSLIHRNPRPAR